MLTKSSWKAPARSSVCRDVTQRRDDRWSSPAVTSWRPLRNLPLTHFTFTCSGHQNNVFYVCVWMIRIATQFIFLPQSVFTLSLPFVSVDITGWFMNEPANYLMIKWAGSVAYVRHSGDRIFLIKARCVRTSFCTLCSPEKRLNRVPEA